jgi:bacterial/archaeal transporter family protein
MTIMKFSADPWLASWLFWALASAGFAALTAIFAKLGVAAIDPDVATFIRVVVITLILGLMLVATGRFAVPGSLSARAILFLVLSALATGASWLCYFRALKLGDAARVAPIDKLSVVMVALFATAFLGESLSSVNWAGIGLIAVGAILVAF